MGYFVRGLLVTLVVFFSAIGQAQARQGEYPNQAAFDAVQAATDKLLNQVTGNRELYLENTELFFADVEGLLSPVIDFQRIARRVMAKHYKKAQPEQQEAFESVFKRSLLKVYASALLDYDNERVVILPPLTNKAANPKRQRVDIEFYSSNGQKFPISYSMFLNKEGQWKMENVVVNGVNIGLTYRNQFARLMKNNQNDIDLAVAGWSSELDSAE